MKKHFAFIPLQEQDVRDFRRLLLNDLWFRPVFAALALAALVFLGIRRTDALGNSIPIFIIYTFSIAFVLYLIFIESSRIHYILKLQKKNLLPFIRTVKQDSSFYTEEIRDGFIIQTEPVNSFDIRQCRDTLEEITLRFAESSYLVSYLKMCINSNDRSLVNKAVIYTEVIREQLELGNLEILATYDRIVNYKGEETAI